MNIRGRIFDFKRRVKKLVSYPKRQVKKTFDAARWSACQIGERNFCTAEELDILNFNYYKFLVPALVGIIIPFLIPTIAYKNGRIYSK